MQYLLDNTSAFADLNFSGLTAKWTPEQQEFINTYPTKSIVYQDAVNYLNPQWMDIGKDMVGMFTGSMTPKEALASIDQRRTDMANTANILAWAQKLTHCLNIPCSPGAWLRGCKIPPTAAACCTRGWRRDMKARVHPFYFVGGALASYLLF